MLWLTNSDRVEHRKALKTELERTLTTRPSDHWLKTLKENDVPCGSINNVAEAFALATELGLNAVQDLAMPKGDTVASVSNPISFSRSAVSYDRAPPALGADTEEVLQWLLERKRSG